MNRKQFFILLAALVVLGGAGFALLWQDIADYRATGAKIGAKLLPQLKIADVAEVRFQDAKQQSTLVRKEKIWVVQERDGYTASFQEISDLLIKLVELKVTQSEQVGASLFPRVDLAEPGKAKEGTGTLVEFKDAGGQTLARMVLGKVVLKKDPMNPLPAAKNGVPAGRYVHVDGAGDTVVVVSDPLEKAAADPGRWLAKDFIKVDRIKTLEVDGPQGWKITRNEEWGQWKFASGGEPLNPSAAVMAVNKLGQLSFDDVVVGAKAEGAEKPVTVVAETFDNLVYTLKLSKQAVGDGYRMTFTLTGEPPKARVPEKGEKEKDKERLDKEFAETSKRLAARLAAERALAKWTFVVGKSDVEPLFRPRSEMAVPKRPDGKK